jgi:hypothetical protein
MVLAMRERTKKTRDGVKKTGRVRFFHIPDGKRATIQPIIDKHVDTKNTFSHPINKGG